MSLRLKYLKTKLYIASWFNLYYWRNLKGRLQRWNRRRIAYRKIATKENVVALSLYEIREVERKNLQKRDKQDINKKWANALTKVKLGEDLPQRNSILENTINSFEPKEPIDNRHIINHLGYYRKK